jgi:hypothetical protein
LQTLRSQWAARSGNVLQKLHVCVDYNINNKKAWLTGLFL